MGLYDGQAVRLKNHSGLVSPSTIKVKLTQRLRHDALYMVHGFGVHAPELTRANNKGVGDEELLDGYAVDPLMGGTAMRTNFVTIVKEG